MDVRERVATALACAALDRRLSGVLLFDLDPELAAPLARWLADLLGEPDRVGVVGAATAEEDLWTRIRPRPGNAEHPGRVTAGFQWEPGPLVGAGRPPAVVLAPDLARLSLAAARAAVTTVAGDVAHLERTGQQAAWVPADRWIAACRRGDVGRVSPHLLDRFAVRVDALGLAATGPEAAGPDADGRHSVGAVGVLAEPAPSWRRAIRAGRLPGMSIAAADRVLSLVPAAGSGVRRELALARIARALAALRGESVVEADHVDDAARLIGLSTGGDDAAAEAIAAADRPVSSELGGAAPGSGEVGQAERDVAALRAEPRPLPAGPLPLPARPGDPYPEDRTDAEREAEPLRVPWRERAAGGPARGHPIGVRAATELRDIALTATLLEAAKFQAVRCPDHYRPPVAHPLHVRAVDLRSHRRAPRPRHLLVLVLDHTCRQGWDWYRALAPYLRWAYAVRAGVGVVEVGAAGARDELCAQWFSGRSLLDPRVAEALDRPAGRATPLAHGLSLAVRLLRHETQHGDAAVGEALLLVVTDGRANVPLEASRERLVRGRAGRAGVDDALAVAAEIGRLHRVRSLVVDPGPRPYAHLTADLAQAIGGSVVPGRPEGADDD